MTPCREILKAPDANVGLRGVSTSDRPLEPRSAQMSETSDWSNDWIVPDAQVRSRLRNAPRVFDGVSAASRGGRLPKPCFRCGCVPSARPGYPDIRPRGGPEPRPVEPRCEALAWGEDRGARLRPARGPDVELFLSEQCVDAATSSGLGFRSRAGWRRCSFSETRDVDAAVPEKDLAPAAWRRAGLFRLRRIGSGATWGTAAPYDTAPPIRRHSSIGTGQDEDPPIPASRTPIL